jgi:hypothetical protein
MPIDRDLMFHVRMAAEERAMLEALAEGHGVSASDYIRIVVRRDYAERFGDKKAKKK